MAKRSSPLKIAATVVAVLVVVLIVAEIVLRMFVAGQVRAGFQEENPQVEAKKEVDISFGAVPLLAGLAAGKINQFSLTTPSTLRIDGDNVSGAPAADVTLHGVGLDDSMTADTVHVISEVPDDFLLATVRNQIAENMPAEAGALAGHLNVTDLTSSAEAGVIDVEFVHGAAVLTLTPVQQNGQLSFSATGGTILGFDLPTSVTEQITRSLQEGLSGRAETGGMQIEELEVIDGGIRTTLIGHQIPLKELSQATRPAA